VSISRVGSATGVTSCTVPTHAVGDLILIFAFRDGSTTAPTLPAGFTSLTTKAGTTCSARVGYKFATATNDASGTWTNATEVVCHVYTGTNSTPNLLNFNSNAGTTNAANFPAFTGFAKNAASWIVGFIGHRSIDQNLDTAVPATMTNVASVVDATASAASHDTNGPVSSWSSTNVTLTGTASGWVSIPVEVVDQPLDGFDPINTGRGTLSTGFTWTNSAKTIQQTSAGTDQTASTGYSSGKHYFELTCVTADTNDGFVGLEGNSGAIFTGLTTDGSLFNSGGTVGTMTATTAGQVVGVSVDATNHLLWIKNVSTGSNWNGSGTDDPATGTGGISFAAGTIYPCVGASSSTGQKYTLNTGGSAFTGTMPSGFSEWYVPTGTNKTLALDAGSYSLIGVNASLIRTRIMAAASASYALTGTIAGLNHNYPLSVVGGSYALTGSTTSLLRSRLFAAGAGSYVLAGQTAGLLRGFKLAMGVGSYALSGASVNFARAYKLIPDAGTYSWTGSNVGLLRGYKVAAGGGSYAINGTDVSLTVSTQKTIAADGGVYNLTGIDAVLRRSRLFSVDGAAYSLNGSNASLTVSTPGAHKGKRKIVGKIVKRRTIYPGKGFV
jgi:hypothetical protein